jgi:CRISPR-associated endonuclease/helicase Cas3
MKFIAHIKPKSECEFEIQELKDHLEETAKLAEVFASQYKNSNWGRLLGNWHDIGKFSKEFQSYIRANSGYEEGEAKGKTDHSSAGAIFAKEMFTYFWPPIAYCIAGHHSGLLNWDTELGTTGDLKSRLQKQDLFDRIKTHIPDSLKITNKLNPPCDKKIAPEQMHLWIRMMFSCLVDADYLDTERFMNPELFEKRGKYDSLKTLKVLFEKHMEGLLSEASKTTVNKIRTRILKQCIQKGNETPGFFSITVPTGGGKTLSSMAWAIEHALKFQKRRIVFAIPYTSIITQTAQVYRDIFGEENVVEHHSNLDEETITQERKLSAENWDAPIIITTNVQLFESLFSNKTSRCRKLHNLVNSIIILDEAQMLPPEFLKPIISVLKGLVENFGVTVLLSTATQPVLTGKIGSGLHSFTGIERDRIHELITDCKTLADDLKRVEIIMPEDLNRFSSWSEIATELKQFDQALCIVNTRKECRELYKQMPEGSIHLSRLMCTSHIMDTIANIKKKLKDGERIHVISTQLIEAGIDIDFPVVYRAITGLDSIAQSAGRCNREGKLNVQNKKGIMKVFHTENGTPPGLIRKGADALKELLHLHSGADFLTPNIFHDSSGHLKPTDC